MKKTNYWIPAIFQVLDGLLWSNRFVEQCRKRLYLTRLEGVLDLWQSSRALERNNTVGKNLELEATRTPDAGKNSVVRISPTTRPNQNLKRVLTQLSQARPLEPVYDLDQGMQCKAKVTEKAEHTRSM